MRWLLILALATSCSSDPPTSNFDAGPSPDAAGVDLGSPDAAVASRLALGLAINHGSRSQVVRGWPVIARASVALEGDLFEPKIVSDDTLSVRILDSSGTQQAWPLQRMDPSDPQRTLGEDQEAAEVRFTLSSTDTRALDLGAYRAELRWGDAAWVIGLDVVDPPSTLSASDRVERASLEHEYHMLHGELTEARDAVSRALALDPASVTLLTQRALVLEALGEDGAALESTGLALEAFTAQFPDAREPPLTILLVQQRLLERILGGGP